LIEKGVYTFIATRLVWGDAVKHILTELRPTTDQGSIENRRFERVPVTLPARLTWKDQHGATRFASVVTRNVSELGVYVETQTPLSIPLYRLVQFQLERDVRETDGLPPSLRQGRVLSAVYRVSPRTKSVPQGLALRLLVEPRRNVAVEATRATA
jgi:hypothetical protein